MTGAICGALLLRPGDPEAPAWRRRLSLANPSRLNGNAHTYDLADPHQRTRERADATSRQHRTGAAIPLNCLRAGAVPFRRAKSKQMKFPGFLLRLSIARTEYLNLTP